LQIVPAAIPKATEAAAGGMSTPFETEKKYTLTSTYVARCGGDGDQTDDGTRAETDDRPLALKTVIPEHPGESTDRGR